MKRRKSKPNDEETDNESQASNNGSTNSTSTVKPTTNRSNQVLFVLIALVVTCAFVFILPALYLDEEDDAIMYYGSIPPEIHLLFQTYDRNEDGVLDRDEFEPIGHKLNSIRANYDLEQEIGDDDEIITLNAFYEPIVEETMTNNISDNSGIFSYEVAFKFLKKWKDPYRAVENFGCKHFLSFLPKNLDEVNVGHVWNLVPQPKDKYDQRMQFSSNVFDPPEPAAEHRTLFRILQMFHKRPFIHGRFPPQGTSLILRAKNRKYLDIMFRVHAEFQLNDAPSNPFWFTPAQFNGRLIIARDLSHIEYFHLYLPNEKRLNIDLEWLNSAKDESMEVDIGYVPRMEIVSSMPSVKKLLKEKDQNGQEVIIPFENQRISPIPIEIYKKMLGQIKWNGDQLDESTANEKLEQAFFPFKQIKYYSFLQAFDKARELGKQWIHFILLGRFG